MDKAKRKAIIAGNWKMNKTPKEAKELLTAIAPLVADADCEVIACVPYVDLAVALEATAGTNVKIGAENCHWKPIVCVGELLWERECNITEEVIARQIKLDLWDVTEEELKNVVIAYEPVWAIGTGKTATSDQAEEVCAFIRAQLAKLYNQDAADAVTIQYGGSMNDGNADELLSKTNVDGGLIGGASLVAEKFAAIVKAASK